MVNLALGILSEIISKTTPLCTSALANTHLIEFVIYQKPNLVLIRIFVPFLFQNETELEKSQFCTFITKKSLWSSVVHHHTLFCNSVICAADFKVNLMYFPGTGVSDQHGRDWVRASQRDLLQCQRLEHSRQCHSAGVILVYFH